MITVSYVTYTQFYYPTLDRNEINKEETKYGSKISEIT
jgi:hypothetical protein